MSRLPPPPVPIPDPDRDARAAAANRVEAARAGLGTVLAAWTAVEPGPLKNDLLNLVLAQMAELRAAVFVQREVGAPRRGDLP